MEETRQDLLEDSYNYNPTYHRFSDYLGVDTETRRDRNIATRVAEIYDWGKNAVGRDDIDAISGRVYELQKSLGVNSLGEDLVKHLYRAIRLNGGKTTKEDIKNTSPHSERPGLIKSDKEKAKLIKMILKKL